jgi:hypothetical protein
MQVNLEVNAPEYLSTDDFVEDRLCIVQCAFLESKHNQERHCKAQECLAHRKQQGMSLHAGDLVLHWVAKPGKLNRSWQGGLQVGRVKGSVVSLVDEDTGQTSSIPVNIKHFKLAFEWHAEMPTPLEPEENKHE